MHHRLKLYVELLSRMFLLYDASLSDVTIDEDYCLLRRDVHFLWNTISNTRSTIAPIALTGIEMFSWRNVIQAALFAVQILALLVETFKYACILHGNLPYRLEA